MNLCNRVFKDKLKNFLSKGTTNHSYLKNDKSFSLFSPALSQCNLKRNVNLNYLSYDNNTIKQTPVVICHGLFGNMLNWRQLSKDINLKSGRKVITFDAVNHGLSAHHDAMSYVDMSWDLVNLLDKLEVEKAILIGHSMGGKTVMTTALSYPSRIAKLVVVDTVPKETASSGEVFGYLEAMQKIDMSQVTSRKMVENELRTAVPSKSLLLFLMSNVRKNGKEFSWRINLKSINQNYPLIHAFPPFSKGINYDNPTLFIGGSRSNYITEVEYSSILKYFPFARIEHIEDAGHWVHAEKPDEFLNLIIPFLN